MSISSRREQYNYPELFHYVDERLLWDIYEMDRTEASSNHQNTLRGNEVEDMVAAAHPEIEPLEDDSVKDFDWRIDGGVKGQTKSCVPEHIYSGKANKKGRFFIPKHTLENPEMKESGIFNFVVVDYEGDYEGEGELQALMEINLPAEEVSEYVEPEKTGIADIKSRDGYTVRYDRIIELCEQVLNSRGESLYSPGGREWQSGLL